MIHDFLCILTCVFCISQELRCREEEVSKAELQIQFEAQHLKEREQQLQIREVELLKREISILMFQQQSTPTPKTRKGKFKGSGIMKILKREPGPNISSPSGK